MGNTTRQKSTGIRGWEIVRLATGLPLLLFAGLYIFYGFNEEGTRQAIRWSARVSVSLFCVAFATSAIHRLRQNSFTFWLLMNRKYLGISFAIIHLIHLAFLLVLQQYFHPVFNLAKASSLMGGGLAYLFIVLMLLTSFPVFSKYLSKKNWKILHTAGGYWIWAIFFISYWKRAMTEYEHFPIVVILVSVVALRLLVRKHKPEKLAGVPG